MAAALATSPPPADAIVLVGFMASGKSTVGAALAAQVGGQLVDTDELCEARAGRTIAALFAQDGEAAFRDLERSVIAGLADVLNDQAGGHTTRDTTARAGPPTARIIATGGGTFVDPANRRALAKLGPTVWLRARPETILARLAGCESTRPLFQGPKDAANLTALLASRVAAYGEALVHIDSDDDSADVIAERILRAVAALRSRPPGDKP